ncbi:MAG: hypothetical protein IJS33_01925 [Firmicutes bacterium]|nr:hypothetical protein [Bacillota bacterium]
MSLKRILVKIGMMLLLWGALYGMFTLTHGVSPWIRVALGFVICAIYVVAQVAINRRQYGESGPNKNTDPNIKKEEK